MGRAEGWARAHKGLLGLLAAGAAALGVLLFLLHPKGQQAAQSALSSLPPQLGGTSGPNDSSTPATATNSPTSSGLWGQIRGIGAVPSWDATHSGVPIWSGLGTGNLLSYLPFGQQVQILDVRSGPPTPGISNGPTEWYKIAWGGFTGWVSAFDFEQFFGQFVPTGSSSNPSPSSLPGVGPAPFPNGPPITLKSQLAKPPASSAVMSGVG